MARNKHPEETVQLILDVAFRLFMEKGYERTSIQDIIDRLGGLSKGAIYHHFKSKDDILMAVTDRMTAQSNQMLADIRDCGNLSGREKLKRIFKESISRPVCTNGQLPDLEAAAAVLKGKHLARDVRGIVIPATMKIYREAMRRGLTDIFLDAGCIVSTPTCGPCLRGYMGILAAGERCVSTTNRNFVGRMGHVDSEVYLASPSVAAASGVAGHICHPEEV